jgi:hypothetical protein
MPQKLATIPWSIGERIVLILIIFAPVVVALIFYIVSTKFIQEDKLRQPAPANPAPRDV